MKNFRFIILLASFLIHYVHAMDQTSPFDPALKFNPHTQLGFEVVHAEGIKGSGTIAVIGNEIYAPSHSALTSVNWINCTNVDDATLQEHSQKQPARNSGNHLLQIVGIIACKPLEIPGGGIAGIDYNIGLAHEANIEAYLTGIYHDESFQGLSNNTFGRKLRNMECDHWIQAFTKIKSSKARVICVSNALPYDVQFEFDFLEKKNTGIPYIRKDVLLTIQDCVADENNERLLVISASNTGQTIGEYNDTWQSMWGFKHLEELVNDPIISKRLIIVGNSCLSLTGHMIYDQGHPQFFNNMKDYYEVLKTYLTGEKLEVPFKDFIQHNSLFQAICEDEIQKLANKRLSESPFLLPPDPFVRQHNFGIMKKSVEREYPRCISLASIDQQLENLEHQFRMSCKLYPAEEGGRVSLYPTSGKAGIAQNIFLSTIGTTILTAIIPDVPTNFPGGILKTYGRSFGTSFSTPIVAAAINLLLQANQSLKVEGAKEVLLAATDKPAQFPEIHGQGEMNFLKAYKHAKSENF